MDDAPRLRSETITLALRTLCRRAASHHPRKDPTQPTPLPPTFRRSGRCDRGPVVRERAGPAGEGRGHHGGTTAHVGQERRSPRQETGPLTWGFERSRLSESNRRPIHDELIETGLAARGLQARLAPSDARVTAGPSRPIVTQRDPPFHGSFAGVRRDSSSRDWPQQKVRCTPPVMAATQAAR